MHLALHDDFGNMEIWAGWGTQDQLAVPLMQTSLSVLLAHDYLWLLNWYVMAFLFFASSLLNLETINLEIKNVCHLTVLFMQQC